MSPDFNGWLLYLILLFIGFLAQVNLVQKSAETFILICLENPFHPFWELLALLWNSKDDEWK